MTTKLTTFPIGVGVFVVMYWVLLLRTEILASDTGPTYGAVIAMMIAAVVMDATDPRVVANE